MVVNSLNSNWDYVGDNATTSFGWDNLVIQDEDLDVYSDGVLQTIVVDYTVAGAGTFAGTVDYLVAPGNGVAVAIVRKTERNQQTAYPNNGAFPAASHEAALDKLTIINQEDDRDFKKAIRFNEFSLIENIFIDDPVADAILTFGPAGLSIIAGPSVQDIEDSEAAAAASAAAAAVSEAAAAVSAAAALASEDEAEDSEIAAAASEAAAAVSEAAAAASAAAAALSAAKLQGTSVTSVTPGVGAKVFETQAGKFFDAGTFLLVTSDGDPSKFMAGQVASYVGTTLTLNVNQFSGAAPLIDWTIQVSGRFGIDGDQVPRTVVIVTGDLDVSAGFVTNTFYQVRPVAEAEVMLTIPDATTAGFIDGFELTAHLDLPGSILVTTPTTPPVTTIEGETDLVISEEMATVTLLASTATDDWQISQDSRPKEGAGITLFATTTADPILAGYTVAVTDNDDVRYDDPSVTVVTTAVTATSRGTAIETTRFIADAGAVTDLLDNDLVLTVSVNTTAGSNRDVQFFAELSLAVSPYGLANETVIDETASSGVVSLSATLQTMLFSNITLDIGATDRLVVRTFSWKTAGGGTDPTVDFAVGGKLPADTPARLKVPQSIQSVAHNSTAGLQGGTVGEFFHLTQLQNDTFPGIIGTDIANSAAPTLPADGAYFEALGTTTRTSYVVAANRRWVEKSVAARTYTASASIVTEDGADITTVAGQVLMFQSTATDVVQVTKAPSAGGGPNVESSVATTSGTTADITGLAGASRIEVTFDQVSYATAQSNWIIQLGDPGGFETAGYTGSGSSIRDGGATVVQRITNGLALNDSNTNFDDVISGTLVLTLLDSSTNTWSIGGTLGSSAGATVRSWSAGGSKSLSAAITQIRLTTTGGSSTFDGGKIGAAWD
ncbi:MAG: hypothetical protein V3T82_07895 [Nitrospinaceae bacterium]